MCKTASWGVGLASVIVHEMTAAMTVQVVILALSIGHSRSLLACRRCLPIAVARYIVLK